jgi:hypothetical protein
MRDIDLIPAPNVPADPDVDDAAYGNTEAAGLIASDTTLTDPAMTDTKAYGRPSSGGDYGPGRAAILGADADGGAADLAVDTTVTVTAPVVPTPQIVWPGRAANNTSVLNLYPWRKTPPEGLDQNNPNPPPAPPGPPPAPPPPTGVTHSSTLVGNNGTATFSGPASRNAIVTVEFSLDGGPVQQLMAMIQTGDTGSQIAAKVRAVVDAFVGLDASGTGGTVNVIGIGGNLTAFNITVS